MSTTVALASAWSAWDFWSLFQHFAALSLLAVGGAITTAPDMHRYLVQDQRWLSDVQFNQSIALAQAAPGPNILFVGLMGWHVGLNAALSMGAPVWLLAPLGLFLSLLGIMLPSSILMVTATRWAHRNQEHRMLRAFKVGMAPVVIALMLSTAWLLTRAGQAQGHPLGLYVLAALTCILVWKTRLHMLWLMAAGAGAGALGWV